MARMCLMLITAECFTPISSPGAIGIQDKEAFDGPLARL